MMSNGSTRILLVDHNPDDRALVRREAEALFAGAEVREAGSREELEAALNPGGYDLVVTDLELRWGNGREVLAAVRQSRPDCAVVMFTGTGDEISAVELMKAGLDDYVVKHARQLPRLRASMKLALESARNRSALSERERQLTAALAYKELIVRELHHRVKNNLQTIVNLLELRARDKGGTIAAELNDLAGRMRALGKVQAGIYEADALDRVEFGATLREIAAEIVKIYGEDRVRLGANIDGSMELEVSRAVPLALLCYEVLLNAMKHAWKDGRTGVLSIELKTGPSPLLRIADDGAGFDEKTIVKGFGSRLTPALAREAGAEVAISSAPEHGTAVIIQLK
jgi:two-component sensor histidine kinase/CheY-like chemotaxis protein